MHTCSQSLKVGETCCSQNQTAFECGSHRYVVKNLTSTPLLLTSKEKSLVTKLLKLVTLALHSTSMMTDYVEAVTYICFILSVIAAISNIASFVYTKKTFNENVPYRILQIECIITTLCQLGFLGVLLGSLQESPNLVMCISASSVAMFDHCMLYITRTALSRVRYVIYTFSILVSLQPYNIFVLWNAS